LKANGYHHLKLKNLIGHRQLRTKEDNNQSQKKRAIFTYTGKETRFITKLFKGFNINISYRTRKTIGSILTLKKILNNNRYDESEVYGLKLQNYPGIYIGQTGRSFKIRYREHVKVLKITKAGQFLASHSKYGARL
jgi:hypothetical protein